MKYDVNKLTPMICKLLIDNFVSLSSDIRMFITTNSNKIINIFESHYKVIRYPEIFYFNGYKPDSENITNNPNNINIQNKFFSLYNKMNEYIKIHENISHTKPITDFYKNSFKSILYDVSDTFENFNKMVSKIYISLLNCFDNEMNIHQDEIIDVFDTAFDLLLFKSEAIKAREDFMYSQFDEFHHVKTNSSFIYSILSLIFNELKYHDKNKNIGLYIDLLYFNTNEFKDDFIKLLNLYSKLCCGHSLVIDTNTSSSDFMEVLSKIYGTDEIKSKNKFNIVIYDEIFIPYGFSKSEFCNIISNITIPNNMTKIIPDNVILNFLGTFKRNYKHMGIYDGKNILHVLNIDNNIYLMTMKNNSSNEIVLMKIDFESYKVESAYEVKLDTGYLFEVGDDIL